jgi:hypothetical protein
MQASFGPFYRIEQLILSTQPRPAGRGHITHADPEELPPIVTDANIRLLFAMQAQVSTAVAPVHHLLCCSPTPKPMSTIIWSTLRACSHAPLSSRPLGPTS